MTVANLKAQFSNVLDDLAKGEEILIEYGKSHKKLGVIIPYEKYIPIERKIGICEDKASYKINGSLKMTDDELISS